MSKVLKDNRRFGRNRADSSTNKLLVLALIGVLVGVGLVAATSYSLGGIIPKTTTIQLPQETVTLTQTQTQTQTQAQTQTVVQTQNVTKTLSTATQTVTISGSSTFNTNTINTMAAQTQNIVSSEPIPASWSNSWSNSLGVKLVGEYNSSGPAAWSAAAHPNVYITTNGPGYGGYMSGQTSPGICIIDAMTYQVVVCRQYAIAGQNGVNAYFEDHGLGASMDGRYIYLPTGNSSATSTALKGELLVIDAQTLLIHQIIESPASFAIHHIEAVRLWNGIDAVIVQPFYFPRGPLGTNGLGSFYLLNPAQDNSVIGGFAGNSLPLPPYLAQADPDGLHLFVSSRSTTGGAGAEFVINMQTWALTQTYTPALGSTPNMEATTDNGQYTYVSDNSGDTVLQINDQTQSIVAVAKSPAAGPYGVTLNYNQTLIYLVGKGESHGNTGKDLGVVNALTMSDVNDFITGGIRGDHAITDPVHTDEIWVSMNSNFEDVAWNTTSNTIDATIHQTGSSHNGAFVSYTVLPNGQWQGMLQSDQDGLHGSALVAQEHALGVTSVVYGSQSYPTEDQRVLPGEPV